jgi:NAD(P)-dependent dehydrogenase (short-subunit alcohol dehydrogenase family)
MKLEVASIMTGKLEGKTALTTGASRGIGRAIAEKFASKGAAFIGVHYGNNEAAAREVVSHIKALGAKAVALQAELTGGKAGADRLWSAFEAAAAKDVGSIESDIRINNAGIAPAVSLDQTSKAVFDDVIAVNLKAPVFPHPGGGGDRPRRPRAGSRPDHHGDAGEQGPPALASEERPGRGAPSGARRRDDG